MSFYRWMFGSWIAGVKIILKSTLVKGLSTVTSQILLFGWRVMNRASPKLAGKLAQEIVNFYYVPPKEWADFIKTYISNMTGISIPVEDIQRLGARVAGPKMAEGIGEKFLKPMLNLIMPEPPLTPEKGLAGANRFMYANLQFQMNAWFLHLIGDMMSFGMFKSLKDLPNAISWSYGIGWLSWLVMGTPFRLAISDPMERLFNKIYLFQRPTAIQLATARRRNLITATEYVEMMREYGYSDEMSDLLFALQDRDPTDAELRKLHEEGWITTDEISYYMLTRGFSPAEAQLLTQLLINDRVLRLRDDLKDEAVKCFEEAIIEEHELRSYLKECNYNEQEIIMVINAAKLRANRKSQLTDAEMRAALRKDLMAWAEVYRKMVAKGWDPHDADIFLKL